LLLWQKALRVECARQRESPETRELSKIGSIWHLTITESTQVEFHQVTSLTLSQRWQVHCLGKIGPVGHQALKVIAILRESQSSELAQKRNQLVQALAFFFPGKLDAYTYRELSNMSRKMR